MRATSCTKYDWTSGRKNCGFLCRYIRRDSIQRRGLSLVIEIAGESKREDREYVPIRHRMHSLKPGP